MCVVWVSVFESSAAVSTSFRILGQLNQVFGLTRLSVRYSYANALVPERQLPDIDNVRKDCKRQNVVPALLSPLFSPISGGLPLLPITLGI